MPIRPLHLPKEHFEALRALCAAGPAKIGALTEALEGQGSFVKPSKFRQSLAQVLGQENARPIDRLLTGLAALLRRHFKNVHEMMLALGAGIVDAEWSDEDKGNWEKCAQSIERLLTIKAVVLASKATDLSYDFHELVLNSRIITDVRPIFDDGRSEIIGATIVQTLRIETTSRDSQREYSFAVSLEDLERLHKSCESALKKAEVARKNVEEKWSVEAVIPRDDTDGDD